MTDQVPPISIVVPAYREAPNIDALVRRVFATMSDAGIEAEMIIVDDDSGDGTADIVERLAAEHPVRVYSRTAERGLASAVLHGFAHAATDLLVVLDADLQHPPEAIPALVTPIARGQADFAIGSRYAPGGQIAERWSRWRRFNSAVATLLARPLIRLSDPMSGFFALHRDTWRRAVGVKAVGYKIGLELAVRARCDRCVEIPITFAARHAATSKLSLRRRSEYLRQLAHLYWFRYGTVVYAWLGRPKSS